MAENKNDEIEKNDEQIILKEGESTENEVSAKRKRNSNLKLKIPTIKIPDPKELIKKQISNIENIFLPYKEPILKYVIPILALIVVLLMILVYVVKYETDEVPNQEQNKTEVYDIFANLNTKTASTPEEISQVEELVQKANLLYQNGNQKEALKLYGRIATYNASLSYYNLGVARAKKGMCKEAIRAFDIAIQNREHITPSAINAAVCSKKLNKTDKFQAYLKLAYKYLPEELDSPLYSYYYALIAYYKNYYFETFSPLKHRTSKFFDDEKNMMEARVNLLFENYGKSATALEKSLIQKDTGALGFVYANMGELDVAKKYIEEAIEYEGNLTAKNIKLLKLKYAHSLVDLKLGNIQSSGAEIKQISDVYEKRIDKSYQLELFLKESIFDVQKAQKFFHKEREFVRYRNYQFIFYFAPFKIFDAKKSINLIKKGSANIALGDTETATEYLKSGAKSSDVNKNIILAVKEALNKRLRIANKILQDMADKNPKHAILHYDLALTYAQLGDMRSAYQHFKRSFHLNARDYLSGVFALLSGDLIGADTTKLEDVLKENLSLELETQEIKNILALLEFRKDNYNALQKWLHNLKSPENEDLFNLGFIYLITTIIENPENWEINQKVARRILGKLPEDLFANMLYLYSRFKDLDIKEFSKTVIHHFQVNRLPLYDFYYGARITQEMFIKLNLLTGQLQPLEKNIEHYYKIEFKNPRGIIQALALTKLYNRKYEESYQLYNKLIDEYNVKDSRTLFLAGVSAIAAKHYANAVALFELAKLKNNMNLETRYALGLLYLEAKNFRAASIQFKKFPNEQFYSDFFDFNVKIPEVIEGVK
jgi:tetratricopeptide (TPR) repeat protein